MKKQTMRSLFPVLCLVLALGGCAKDREEKFAQLQGHNLNLVSDFDGKEFVLNTGDEIGSTRSSAFNKVYVSEKLAKLNRFPLVKIAESGAPLLGDPPFVGRPNKTDGTYKGRYVLTENFLKIMKVAKRKDISYEEYPYAEIIEHGATDADDLIQVPMVGYKLAGYYNEEKRLDSNDEETKERIERREDQKEGSKYFRFDPTSRTVFEGITKVDVFPSDLFFKRNEKGSVEIKKFSEIPDSELWYFAETTIDTPDEASNAIGGSSGSRYSEQADSGFKSATKIALLPSINGIIGKNASVDERVHSRKPIIEDTDHERVLFIPAEWQDFQAVDLGKDKGLAEEVKVKRPELERDYIKFNFAYLGSPMQNAVETPTLVDLEIDENYIGFTYLKPATRERIRQSLMRVGQREYLPRQYAEKDQRLFGFFSSDKPRFLTWDYHWEEDKDRLVRLNRFNPIKDIIFYMTDTSPQEYRPVVEKAIESWNEAFHKIGSPMQMKLHPSQVVRLGDLRYNAVNLVDSVNDTAGLLGYGPKITDPSTGEIISSTANVYLTGLKTLLSGYIRNYILRNIGLLGSSDVASMDLGDASTASVAGLEALQPHYKLSKNGSYEKVEPNLDQLVERLHQQGMISKNDLSHFEEADSAEEKGMLLMDVLSSHQDILDSSTPRGSKFMDRAMTEKCSKLGGYVADLALNFENISISERRSCPKGMTHRSDELEVISECIEVLLSYQLQHTLIHEVGHGIGLRHNFLASTDEKNYWTAEEVGINANLELNEVVPSSSVMEYPAITDNLLPMPGKYDLAALRYGYKDEVELQDDDGTLSTLQLVTAAEDGRGKTIAENLEDKGIVTAHLIHYEYCEDRESMQGTDPLCLKNDSGIKPADIAQNLIDQYYQSFRNSRYRFDRVRFIDPMQTAQRHRGAIFVPLRRLYDEWRFVLQSCIPSGQEYLENYNTEQYGEELSETEEGYTFTPGSVLDKAYTNTENPSCKDKIDRYWPVRKKVSDFFFNVATMPNKYCFTIKDRKPVLIELDVIRQNLKSQTANTDVRSCFDPLVAEYLGVPTEQRENLIQEIGDDVKAGRFSLNDRDIKERYDYAGSDLERMNAFDTIGFRAFPREIEKDGKKGLTFIPGTVVHMNKNFYPNLFDEPDLRQQWTNYFARRLTVGVDVKVKDPRGYGGEIPVKGIPRFMQESDILKNQFIDFVRSLDIPQKVLVERFETFYIKKKPSKNLVDKGEMVADIGGTIMTADPAKNTFGASMLAAYASAKMNTLALQIGHEGIEKQIEEFREKFGSRVKTQSDFLMHEQTAVQSFNQLKANEYFGRAFHKPEEAPAESLTESAGAENNTGEISTSPDDSFTPPVTESSNTSELTSSPTIAFTPPAMNSNSSTPDWDAYFGQGAEASTESAVVEDPASSPRVRELVQKMSLKGEESLQAAKELLPFLPEGQRPVLFGDLLDQANEVMVWLNTHPGAGLVVQDSQFYKGLKMFMASVDRKPRELAQGGGSPEDMKMMIVDLSKRPALEVLKELGISNPFVEESFQDLDSLKSQLVERLSKMEEHRGDLSAQKTLLESIILGTARAI